MPSKREIRRAAATDMRAQAELFLASRNLSVLAAILQTFEEESDNYSPSLLASELVFLELLRRGDLCKEKNPAKGDETDALRALYDLTWRHIRTCLTRGVPTSRRCALAVAIRLLQQHGRTPTQSVPPDRYYFPADLLQVLVEALLNKEVDTTGLAVTLGEAAANDDVILHAWRCLASIAPRVLPSDIYACNFLSVAASLRLRAATPQLPTLPTLLCDVEGKAPFRFPLASVTRWMERTWEAVAGWHMGAEPQRRALLLLLDVLLPHLPRPLRTADFLLDCAGGDGAPALLALHGVLQLMQRHHLDYPHVYSKLYSHLRPTLFQTKHRQRLYHLTDLFLGSTHLPEALVAGFAKRLSRLALLAPAPDSAVMLTLVSNLLLRHPSLRRLTVHPGEAPAVSRDPYSNEKEEPECSDALLSSLWEAAGLRCHALGGVREAALHALMPPSRVELPLAPLLDDTIEELFEKELNKSYQRVFLTFSRPQSLYLSSGECVAQHWELF